MAKEAVDRVEEFEEKEACCKMLSPENEENLGYLDKHLIHNFILSIKYQRIGGWDRGDRMYTVFAFDRLYPFNPTG